MPNWTRRELVKNGLLAGAAVLTPNIVHALGSGAASEGDADLPPTRPALPASTTRERIRLDEGWRFSLGHSVDPTLGFGHGGGGFAKGGNLFVPSSPKFDASAWRAVDLPHDWALDLPFVADPRLSDWGFKPIHRDYPDTSIGWYRKVFALPA